MCKDSEKDCNTCRHNPGCLKRGWQSFSCSSRLAATGSSPVTLTAI